MTSFACIMFLVSSILAMFLTLSQGSIPTRGPPLAQVEVEKVVARVGENLKIVCPVEGNPTPIINWHMDDEVIDYTWTRMKTSKKVLKIKNAQKEDTGVLVCKAINGFGSVQVRIELIVIDASNEQMRHQDSSGLPLAAPVLTKKTLASRSLYKKLPGDSFLLNCEALGSPQPILTWIHNRVTISNAPTLEIRSLTTDDSGDYVCVASNLVGRASKEFSLTVSSPRVDLPVISEMKNVSVREGETGVVQCSVSSSVQAHVKWLKKVEQDQDFTVSVANMRLVVVESGEVRLGDGMYISNLVIQRVQTSHQGLYVCFATNTAGGFNYRTTTLTVLPDKIYELEMSTLVLALVISLAAVVLTLLVILVLCVVKAKRKVLVPESPESHRTLMSQISSNCENSQHGVSIYRGLSHPENEKNEEHSISYKTNDDHSISYKTNGDHSNCYKKMEAETTANQVDLQSDRCSSRATDHYEVPYSHLNNTKPDLSYRYCKIPTIYQTNDNHSTKQQRSSYCVADNLNLSSHQVPSYHVQNLCHLQTPVPNRQRPEISFSSPASQKWGHLQSARLTEYQNC